MDKNLWGGSLKTPPGLNRVKTIEHVSVPNLKISGPMKTELWTKEVRGFSIRDGPLFPPPPGGIVISRRQEIYGDF